MEHRYAVGDPVLTTQPIVSTPTIATSARVEIPSASYGVITSIDSTDETVRYTVDFTVADASRRAWVLPCEIMPFPLPKARHKRPTSDRPHRLCGTLHPLCNALLFIAYALVVIIEPTALLAGLLIMLAAYAHQLWCYRTWMWIPMIFRTPTPCEDEELEIDEVWAKTAACNDIAFLGVLTTLILGHVAYRIDPTFLAVAFHITTLVITGISGALKMYAHDRASRIYIKSVD